MANMAGRFKEAIKGPRAARVPARGPLVNNPLLSQAVLGTSGPFSHHTDHVEQRALGGKPLAPWGRLDMKAEGSFKAAPAPAPLPHHPHTVAAPAAAGVLVDTLPAPLQEEAQNDVWVEEPAAAWAGPRVQTKSRRTPTPQPLPSPTSSADLATTTWLLTVSAQGTACEVSPRKPEMQDRHMVLPDVARLAHQFNRSIEQQRTQLDRRAVQPEPVKPSLFSVCESVSSIGVGNSIDLDLGWQPYDSSDCAADDYGDECEEAFSERAQSPVTITPQRNVAAPAAVPWWQQPSLLTAVFDGHRGCLSAQTAVQHLGHMVLNSKPLWSVLSAAVTHAGCILEDKVVVEVQQALRQLFMQLDGQIAHQMRIRGTLRHDGACALVGLQMGHHLFVANVGDSRAVLCRGNAAVRISRDHTPDLDDERARIQAAGGTVCMYKGCWRVVLDKSATGQGIKMCAVSRAVGDFDYKQPQELISAVPDVHHIHLKPLHDQFVVYASDGVWSHITDQQAVNMVQVVMSKGAQLGLSLSQQAEDAAGVLLEQARARGSTDDITVVVTPLTWAPA